MTITEIRLSNVRSYELFSAELHPEITLLLGRNGSGKTTLLEGLYYLSQGSSFRGRAREMIAHDSTRADLLLRDSADTVRRASLQQTADDMIKKSFEIEGKSSQRMLARHRLPIVLFEPDELRLLSSSPERRRRFFDGILTRLYPQYATILARYQRTLLQRNELLKQYRDATSRQTSFRGRSDVSGFTPDTSGGVEPLLKNIENQLFVWDMKFAELALEITRQRREFVVTSNTHLSRLYSQMAHSEHHVTVSYHSSIPSENYQQLLLNTIHANRTADSYRGYTSAGPHRDDFILLLDGHPASETASRGELRTIMLAYKLLEVELQREVYQSAPLILLDDVFSELDRVRETQLMQSLAGLQTIITATDLRDSLKAQGAIVNL